jgi:hypothetical protein
VRTKLWKNFAGFTGDLCALLLVVDKVAAQNAFAYTYWHSYSNTAAYSDTTSQRNNENSSDSGASAVNPKELNIN